MRALPWRVPFVLLLSMWTAVPHAQARSSASDYFVSSLPGAPEPLLRMHAGLIEVDPTHHGNLFFWHFANRHIGDKQRTVIWLNGGPGCSSLDGALMEIGPYRVRDGSRLEYNNGSWDEFANLLFIDSPVGTGFSYGDSNSYLHELGEVADGIVQFLEKFFSLFPEYATDDVYVAGESFAGQYIPYVGRAIQERNKQAAQKWNLRGLMIGNGWFTPKQYKSYLPFSYKNGVLKQGSPEAAIVEKEQVLCDSVLEREWDKSIDITACEKVLLEVFNQNRINNGDNAPCVNMYDVRKTDSFPSCGNSWPEDLPNVKIYLRQQSVRAALHIDAGSSPAGWQECNGNVHAALTNKKSQPSINLLPSLLSEIPVLLFNGDRDLICNHIGQELVMSELEFNNGKGMETSPGVTAPKLDWTFNGQLAGTYQEARNLTQVLFYNTSHMVPYDEAILSRDMLNRFIGVDYDYVKGGAPLSTIDGENANKGKNGTLSSEEEKQILDHERWRAYYRSGEVALVVVAIAAGLWIWWVIRQRRKMKGYKGLLSRLPDEDEDDDHRGSGGRNARGAGTGRLRLGKTRNGGAGDLEAADFDETELDNLGRKGGKSNKGDKRFFSDREDEEEEHFDVGEDSDDGDLTRGKENGHAHGNGTANGHKG